jgi:hypothetical protein
MRVPAGLSEPARHEWRAAHAAIEAYGHDPAEFAVPMRRYAVAAGRLAELEAAWRTEEGAKVGAIGSRGQKTVHPFLIELRELETHVARLGEALPLAPMGRRSTGGWPQGRARSPDRQFRPRRSSNVVPMRFSDRVEAAISDAGSG